MNARMSLALVLLSSGCGRDVAVGGDDDWMSADELCERSTRIRCEANLDCCPDEDWVFDTIEACVSEEEAECAIYGDDAFDDGRLTIDAAVADEMLDDLENEAAACADLPVSLELFDRLFVGTVTEGGDCTIHGADISPALACAQGLYCELTIGDATSPGTCRRIADLGETCRPGDFLLDGPCSAGSYCGGAGDPRCVPLEPVGAECETSDQCETDYCDGCRCVEEPAGPGPFCLYVEHEDACTGWSSAGLSRDATSCSSDWSCGTEYRVECALDGEEFDCTCLEDTVVVGSFRSVGFCDPDVTDDVTREAAAEAGCGWALRT
jgi:hypothetical protein